MKNKKVSILLVFALAFTTLLTGCGSDPASASKPAGDVLRAGIEKQFEIESAHSVMDATLNVELPDEASNNPDLAIIAPMLKDAKLNVEQNANLKEGLAYSNFTAEAGGQKIAAEIYMLSPTKMAVKSDLFPQVVVLDMDSMMEMAAMGASQEELNKMPTTFNAIYSEEFKPLVKAYLDILDEAFKGNEHTARETEEIEIAGEKVSLDMITYSYKSNDEVLGLVEKVANNVFESEKMYDLMFKNEAILDLMGEEAKAQVPTKEDYDDGMKMAKEEFDKEFPKAKEEMDKVVEIKDLTFKVGVDGDGFIRYTKVGFEATIKQDGMELPVKLTMDSTVDNINAVKSEDIQTIDLDSEDTINFEELLRGMFMGGMEMEMYDMDAEDELDVDEDMENMDMDDMDAEDELDVDDIEAENMDDIEMDDAEASE